MSVSVVLRAAPIVTVTELTEPETVRHHEMYERCALKPRPGLDVPDVPVRVDHVKGDTPIGRVTATRTDGCWTGGTWFWVHAEITDPPAWLRKGTGVSISRSAYKVRDLGAGWDLICGAILTEVSLLSPGVRAAFPQAQVVWLEERENPAAARPDRRAAAGEVIVHPSPRRRASRRLLFDDHEIKRRLAFADETGIPGAVEREILHMQALERAHAAGVR